MNSIYIYSSVSGLTIFEKHYAARPECLPTPSAVLAIHQASVMIKTHTLSPSNNNPSCLSVRKGENFVLISELTGSGFIVAIIVDPLISNNGAMEVLRTIVEDVGKLAVVSFSRRLMTESLSKSYRSVLLRLADHLERTVGFVSNHTLKVLFACTPSAPMCTSSTSKIPEPEHCKDEDKESLDIHGSSSIGWMQYLLLTMVRMSPFRSRAVHHKVTPEIVPCISPSPTQSHRVSICPYIEFGTTGLDRTECSNSDDFLDLEVSTAPTIVQSIVQHLQKQPSRAPWKTSTHIEAYLYDPEDKSLHGPATITESSLSGESEEVRPAALSVEPTTTVMRNDTVKSGVSNSRKDNTVYLQQQRQVAQLRVLYFPDQQLVAVFQRKSGASIVDVHRQSGMVENTCPQSLINVIPPSAELLDFQLWAKACLQKKMLPGVKELPVDFQ